MPAHVRPAIPAAGRRAAPSHVETLAPRLRRTLGRSDFAGLALPTSRPSSNPTSRSSSIARCRGTRRGYGSHAETGAGRAVDDLVSRRGLDLRRLPAVLSAAESHDAPRRATVRYLLPPGAAADRAHLHAAAAARARRFAVDDEGRRCVEHRRLRRRSRATHADHRRAGDVPEHAGAGLRGRTRIAPA